MAFSDIAFCSWSYNVLLNSCVKRASHSILWFRFACHLEFDSSHRNIIVVLTFSFDSWLSHWKKNKFTEFQHDRYNSIFSICMKMDSIDRNRDKSNGLIKRKENRIAFQRFLSEKNRHWRRQKKEKQTVLMVTKRRVLQGQVLNKSCTFKLQYWLPIRFWICAVLKFRLLFLFLYVCIHPGIAIREPEFCMQLFQQNCRPIRLPIDLSKYWINYC